MTHTLRTALHGALAALALAAASGTHAAAVPGQGTWESDLVGRDLDGNAANGFEAYYDKALNITWLADGNYAKTAKFDSNGDGRVTSSDGGMMTWERATGTFLDSVNAGAGLYGITGWRLPKADPVGGFTGYQVSKSALTGLQVQTAYNLKLSYDGSTDQGFAVTGKGWGKGNELGHLFYVTMGNKGECDPVKSGQSCIGQAGYSYFQNTGPFLNFQALQYWTGSPAITEVGTNVVGAAINFLPYLGRQWVGAVHDTIGSADVGYVMLVHDGDIAAAVPEPGTGFMAVCGLAALAVMRRRRA